MFKIRLIVPLIAMAILVTGCIRTDRSDCVSGIDLTFDYVLNPENIDKFDTAVAKVSVFAFDEFGKYYGKEEATVDQIIRNGRKMRLPFPTGNYTVLVWGGMLDTYTIGKKTSTTDIETGLQPGITGIEEFRIWINEDTGKPAAQYPYAQTPSDLFFGRGSIQVKNTRAEFKISLIKNTQTIKIIFVEKEGTRGGSRAEAPYGILVHGDNTRLNQNNFIPDGSPEYIYDPLSPGELTDEGYEVEFKTMRLERSKSESLKLELEDAALIAVPNDGYIVEMLRRLKDSNGNLIYPDQISMDREDEFEIKIEIIVEPGTDVILKIQVYINGWFYQTLDPIIP